jgi:hypothetical protein
MNYFYLKENKMEQKEQFKKMLYRKIAQRAKETGKSLPKASREIRKALSKQS